MPWMLPDGEISGVFMSACASTQISPTFWSFARKCSATPLIVPIAML